MMLEESGCDYECLIPVPHTHYIEYHPTVRDPRPVPPHCPPGTERCLMCLTMDAYMGVALDTLGTPLFLDYKDSGVPVKLTFYGMADETT